MKTILKTITILLLIFTLCNCSKDDDNNLEPTTQRLLIGKWYYSVTSNGDASACEAQSYYNFIDTQTLEYQLVIDDFGIGVSGYELIDDCYASPATSVNYTLNASNQIQYLNAYENTVTLNIVSINETTLVFTQGTLDDTTIYILTKDL